MIFKTGDRVIGINTWNHANDGRFGTVRYRIADGWVFVTWSKGLELIEEVSAVRLCEQGREVKNMDYSGVLDYYKSFYSSPAKNYNKVEFKDAKYGVCYLRSVDPVEFFKTLSGAKKRIEELLFDQTVDRKSIYLFEIAKKQKVKATANFTLEDA